VKAAFLVERLAQALAGQYLCSTFLLLIILGVSLPPQQAHPRRRAARVSIALATLVVSMASFSTWIMAATLSVLAQDF
jgi:hypothetical protein